MTDLITADRCERRPQGRPTIGPEPMSLWMRVGMTKSQHDKVMRNGGSRWIRDLIDAMPDSK